MILKGVFVKVNGSKKSLRVKELSIEAFIILNIKDILSLDNNKK
jgi:hypothetical protein